MSFEKDMKRLESIVEKMENSDLDLEEAVALFEEGLKKSHQCQEHLEKAEQKVKVLLGIDKNSKPKTKDFEDESPS